MVRQMFLRLVNLGDGIEDTRRRVARSEFMPIRGSEDLGEEIIDLFASYRLLSLDHNPITRSLTVELAHEAILREWDRLCVWLDTYREDVRLQRLLANAAAEWNESGRDSSYLLRGIRLTQFEEWAD